MTTFQGAALAHPGHLGDHHHRGAAFPITLRRKVALARTASEGWLVLESRPDVPAVLGFHHPRMVTGRQVPGCGERLQGLPGTAIRSTA
ncbi:hypothetical protein CG723_21985 [Streptomyces sp. CB01635]|nr:hypothetical protein CG723_21985 [Streptomyces sp. CB01635]